MRSVFSVAMVSALVGLVGCSGTSTGVPSSSSGSSGRSGFDPPTAESGTGVTEPPQPSDPSGDFAALFGPPSNTTTTLNEVTGLWAGTAYNDDIRLKVSSTSITIAVRCSSGVQGGTVAASVSGNEIRILESKSVPQGSFSSCGFSARPLSIERCTSGVYECFSVSGSTLLFKGVRPFSLSSGSTLDEELTKLSD